MALRNRRPRQALRETPGGNRTVRDGRPQDEPHGSIKLAEAVKNGLIAATDGFATA
jgi:hypothetical protein